MDLSPRQQFGLVDPRGVAVLARRLPGNLVGWVMMAPGLALMPVLPSALMVHEALEVLRPVPGATAFRLTLNTLLDPERVSLVYTGRFGTYGRNPAPLVAGLMALILVGAVVPFGGYAVDWWLAREERRAPARPPWCATTPPRNAIADAPERRSTSGG